MSKAGEVFAVAALVARAWAVAPVAEAQPPIRIGATLSQTGVYATQGQNFLRGYQLCVKHVNEKGGVLGRKIELLVYYDASDLMGVDLAGLGSALNAALHWTPRVSVIVQFATGEREFFGRDRNGEMRQFATFELWSSNLGA